MRQSVREAINTVAAEYTQRDNILPLPVPVVIVCGTAFIMAEARAELGVIEPRDSDSLRDPLSSSDNVDSQVRTWIPLLTLTLKTPSLIYLSSSLMFVMIRCFKISFRTQFINL